MAPGPNLCRLERTSAARQTWRVGARSPGEISGAFVLSHPASGRLVRGRGVRAVTLAALQSAEERRIIEIDVAERAAEQLECVAGEGIGVVRIDAELLGYSLVTFA